MRAMRVSPGTVHANKSLYVSLRTCTNLFILLWARRNSLGRLIILLIRLSVLWWSNVSCLLLQVCLGTPTPLSDPLDPLEGTKGYLDGFQFST